MGSYPKNKNIFLFFGNETKKTTERFELSILEFAILRNNRYTMLSFSKIASRGIRTPNNKVNSRVLYHWAIKACLSKNTNYLR